MPRQNEITFTKKTLENLELPTDTSRPVYHDKVVNGLDLRITKNGVISFFVLRRVNGKVQRTTIGEYPSTTIPQARDEALSILGQISKGINPNNNKEGQLTKRTLTLEKVFKDYQRSRGTNLEESTIKGYKSIIDNQLGDWKEIPLSEIKRSMVENRFLDVTHGTGKFIQMEGSPTRANTMIRVLRALYNYAMGQYVDAREEPLILHNPTAIISHNRAWNRENPRTGVVKEYNLKGWYEGIMKLPEHDRNLAKANSSEVDRDVFIFLFLLYSD